MTHTAGWWGDTFFETGDGDDAIAKLVEEWLPKLPQYAPLGMFASYNNGATILLGGCLRSSRANGIATSSRTSCSIPSG